MTGRRPVSSAEIICFSRISSTLPPVIPIVVFGKKDILKLRSPSSAHMEVGQSVREKETDLATDRPTQAVLEFVFFCFFFFFFRPSWKRFHKSTKIQITWVINQVKLGFVLTRLNKIKIYLLLRSNAFKKEASSSWNLLFVSE